VTDGAGSEDDRAATDGAGSEDDRAATDGAGSEEDRAATGAEWPVELSGVTESVVTTRGPDGRWNLAALGLFAGDPVTARTWGNTRTRRNFDREGEGYVQFTRDPITFVDAALSIAEFEEPVVEGVDAWVRVEAEGVETGVDGGTRWERWELRPIDAGVRRRRVGTIDRGIGAVVEATVAASRLEVSAYDDEPLQTILDHCASVVDGAGDDRAREAMARIRERSAWEPADDNEWL